MKDEYKITKRINKLVIGKILEIKEKRGLTPETIVQEAEDRHSILHDFFTWDDKKAGNLYRLRQASVLINKIEIVIENKNVPAFENVIVKYGLGDRREYKESREIISNKDLRKQIVSRALNSLLYWKDIYARYNYKEFKPIIKEIDKIKKKVLK